MSYYFFISKDEYKSSVYANKKIRFLYIFNIIFICFAILIIVFSISSIIFRDVDIEYKFRGVVLIFVFLPLLLGIVRAQHIVAMRYKLIDDMWINEKGIHLPFPISLKEMKYFVDFDDINRIEVWRHPKDIYDSYIYIFLKSSFKADSIFQPNNRVMLPHVNPDSFISAIKRATNNSIETQNKILKLF